MMKLAMALRIPSRISQLPGRMRAWRSARREPLPIPQGIIDGIANAQSTADVGVARADYALEMASNTPLLLRMLALKSWLELRPPPSGPPISVILAARDRPKLLPRAIASVLAQRYERWELVVVDDGDTDAVATTLAHHDDDRIVVADGPRHGLAVSRNAGLRRATGEIVCYLDDDNVMHPDWLHVVAHVFSQRDDIDVAYGITLAEHRLPRDLGVEWWPSHWQLPWSRETLLERNITDAGALAHRRELEEARFDEDLRTGEDWDLLLRLTADREALAVPALSHAYSMDGADRMSEHPEHLAGLEEIRRRHAER